eukprot:m.163768 g.163768  ORF g.163768 m.163768 type:complete len:348 (+) comp12336_c0_seq1:1484-2527(+)
MGNVCLAPIVELHVGIIEQSAQEASENPKNGKQKNVESIVSNVATNGELILGKAIRVEIVSFVQDHQRKVCNDAHKVRSDNQVCIKVADGFFKGENHSTNGCAKGTCDTGRRACSHKEALVVIVVQRCKLLAKQRLRHPHHVERDGGSQMNGGTFWANGQSRRHCQDGANDLHNDHKPIKTPWCHNPVEIRDNFWNARATCLWLDKHNEGSGYQKTRHDANVCDPRIAVVATGHVLLQCIHTQILNLIHNVIHTKVHDGDGDSGSQQEQPPHPGLGLALVQRSLGERVFIMARVVAKVKVCAFRLRELGHAAPHCLKGNGRRYHGMCGCQQVSPLQGRVLRAAAVTG